ncbi:O-antigen ligase family protein [Acidocella aromatica]|uniref:O-antigen ligase-related domain-containing protein n=1 Tax=Acidocella aromatica TaxID=1303579 RepID=A0A840VCE0_9PROT|nr:O-antigen ligase family protein [Acidocella aromatica]MBB5373473.1 hypothetical protein [Acidocella aromatica]
MIPALVAVAALCFLGLIFYFPQATALLWVLALETSPDAWLAQLIGGHETIIALIKASGIGLALVLAIRQGVRWDRFNPAFAFATMFLIGLMHGLYPGLSLVDSLRSLIGSCAPFLFSFVRLPPNIIRSVIRAAIWGPLFTVGFGALLALTGLGHMYVVEQGALRLGASGEPPFLAGFALIGIYAGLMESLAAANATTTFMVAVNFCIVLLTGARTPLFLAALNILAVLIMQRRLYLLALAGALGSAAILFAKGLTFIRVVGLTELDEAANLSNRGLVWPYFQQALLHSPVFGWGVGAGKVIIPVTSILDQMIGTNAAHDEYLRIGAEGGFFGLALLIGLMTLWMLRGTAGLPRPQRHLMRLIFISFAVHSTMDNTLIATTASVFFLWISCIFANTENGTTPAA